MTGHGTGRAPALDDAGPADGAGLPRDDRTAAESHHAEDAPLPDRDLFPDDGLLAGEERPGDDDRLTADDGPAGDAGLEDATVLDGSDGPDAQPEDDRPAEDAASFRELRPPRRLRLWQLAPIVGLAAVGSLMFAFPLAFEFGGDGGAVFAMLGLLLCCCAAGWGMMAARRVGHTWPGLAARGSGRRTDWRVVAVYVAVVLVLAALAIWRVARLR
ncbi:hypothetical protein [Streptomyces purpurogeneiscleroticus]|uniref:hypothetical protein n=1 Tax=Streptomyces purpurogeneiscleroticus TaxID=68259 RepID=UPI001CBF9F95|nr:hypothetical protein [Streptomyces purpurogeneiscleroticus]